MPTHRVIDFGFVADACRWCATICVAAGLVVVAGCGGSDTSSDPCADTTCAYGVCDSETGACRNPETCGSEGGADAGGAQGGGCLRGYSCVQGACEADIPCGGESCARGVCRKGACVNAEPCADRSECLEGLGCSEGGVCENLCADKTCSRGVCNPETGECENPSSCDPEDPEAPRCLASAICMDGDDDGQFECLGEEAYCELLDCQRGTCSFEAERCIDRETCTADADCVEGHYCDTQINECKTNACAADGAGDGECPRGVCEKATGECVNPTRCQASDECLPDHSCVENHCVKKGRECGPSGCPGNQLCDYDPSSLSATCERNPEVPCRDAIDCTGNDICRDGECVAPQACEPDDLEPNDTTQVDFLEAAFQGTVTANICNVGGREDVDRYTFDLEEARGDSLRGRLYIDLQIQPVDVGRGHATLTVTDQSGRILARRSTDEAGRLHLERSVTALEISSLQFKVSGSDVNLAGFRYNLFAGVAPQSTVLACRGATTIQPDGMRSPSGPITGHTGGGVGQQMGGSCVDEGEETGEKVYKFNLDQRSYVTLVARPTESFDLTLALRRYCASLGSEAGCSDVAGVGEPESLGRELEPGTYTVVVQGDRARDSGAFELSYEAEPIVCSADQDRCTGSSKALICRDNRTTFTEVECESTCDMQTGRCDRPAGDVCYTAVEAGGDLSTEIDWTGLSNAFEPEVGCVGASQDTGGPDKVFRVDVPAGEVLEADVSFDTPAGDGALYVMQNCGDAAGSCVASADSNESSEHLAYYNDTPYEQNLYVVADSKSGTDYTATAFELSTKPPQCEPGSTRCAAGDREVCNDAGTGYTLETCTYGCSQGDCASPPFDTCSGAVDLTGGGTASASYDDLSEDYEVGEGCAGDASPGRDAVYRVDLQSGEVMTATIEAVGSLTDPMAYVVSDCSSPTAVEASCQRGVDANYAGSDETLRFRAPDGYSGTRSYWVVVDSDGDGGEGSYKLDVSTQSSVCSPGSRTCSGSATDVVELCGEFGLQYSQYTCQGSTTTCQSTSSGAVCPEPTGEQCADPIPLGKNQSVTGVYGGTNDVEVSEGTVGSCQIRQGNRTDGPETIYSVQLDSGDLLTADLDTTHDDSMLYVLGNCVVSKSCEAGSLTKGGDQRVQYLAETSETVFVVVDSTFDSGNDQYTLDLTTSPQTTCIPDSIGCTGASSVGVCNEAGTAYRSDFQCDTTCRADACEPPGLNVPGALPQNSCGTAPDVGTGTVVSGDWSRLTNAAAAPSGVCGAEAGVGHDAIYKVDVLQGQILNLQLESFGDETPYLYVLKDCANLNSCPAGSVGRDGGAELRYKSTATETLYVVADTTALNPDDAFRLSIERLNPVCTPGSRACTSNGQALRVCQQIGLYQTEICDGGCQNSGCVHPSGDWCPDARPLAVGGEFSGSFEAFDNQIDMARTPSCGIHAESDVPDGPDAIFEVTGVSAGETLVADLQTSLSEVNMYVLNSCPLGDSMPTGACEWGVSDDDDLSYLVDGSGPVYLAVDTQRPDAVEDFTVSVDTRTGDVCQPGGGSCSGSQTLEVCAGDGASVERTVVCSSGCSTSGYCQRSPTAPETCGTAMSLGSSGTRLRDTTERFTDDLSPGCIGHTGGADAVYQVDVPAGEAMQAVVTPVDGGMDPTVYVLPTCGTASSCVHPSKTTNTPWQTQPATTGYFNDGAQRETVSVVVDHGDDGGEYELDIEVGAPECAQSAQGTASCLGDETLGRCTSYRMYRPTHCDFGCDSGTQSCASVPNDTCSGAVSLRADTTYSADIGEYLDDYDPASAGGSSCLASGQGSGPDAVYQVQLDQGDVFDATLQTPGDPVLWATTDCTSAATSCVAGANASSERERLTFTAPSTDTYYIMVDTDDGSAPPPPGPFALEVDHTGPAACDAGTRACTGPMGNRISYCQASGLDSSQKTCAGTCSSGSCTQNPGDFCEDATPATDGDSFSFGYTDFSDDYDLSQSSCVGYETSGNDRVFEVTLSPGETLTVNAKSQNGSDWVQAYVAAACGDTARLAASCQKGVDFGGSSGSLTFSPTIATETTYFVVIDGWLADTSGQVTVDVTIQ